MMMDYSDSNALTFSDNWMSDAYYPDVIKASNSGDL
jgi:hypothetical protein